MGWATSYIAKLRAGETVSFRPRGDSMSPRIESGDLCTVEPVDPATLRAGDVVLCKVRGAEYLHLV
jgi:phage repressor protein C with HTH and peptisase S24 domain